MFSNNYSLGGQSVACWGVRDAQVALLAASSSYALLGLAQPDKTKPLRLSLDLILEAFAGQVHGYHAQ